MMKKVLLCILDGVGLSNNTVGNALYNADTKTLDKLLKNYPNSKLDASGELVGLPLGQMGNSEVGHMNIGAGRIVYQPLGLINTKIKDESFYQNKKLLNVVEHVKNNQSKLHIMGLLSDGGIHSHINHIFAILELCKRNNLDRVYLHMFTDGRDTSPYSGEKYIKELEEKINELKVGSIATLSGRYYSMDRDNNYDRIFLSYNAIVNGIGPKYKNALLAWGENHQQNITDEFIIPSIINAEGNIESNDGIIYANFRPDRIRELASSLTNKTFKQFENAYNQISKDMFGIKFKKLLKKENKTEDEKNLINTIIDNTNNPNIELTNYEEYRELYNQVIEKLTPLEECVFILKIENFDYQEIASILDKDKKSIDNAIQRIKSKIKSIIYE